MTTLSAVEESIAIDHLGLRLVRAGSGPPLLILHDELGYPGWMEWQAALAKERTLLIPLAPGFGAAPRIEWIGSVRDLACLYARMIREENLAPIDIIGFSLGGWIAAEMAVGDPAIFRRMVLVAPLGIKPPEGALLDTFELPAQGQLEASVFDRNATPEFAKLYGEPGPEQFEMLEDARAECARLAWQPYLHNPSLPHLLEGVSKLPTLLIWGEQDRIVPRSAIDTYRRVLRQSRQINLAKCGHRPEIENKNDFVAAVKNFLA